MLNLLTSVVSALEKKKEPVITDYELMFLIYKLIDDVNPIDVSSVVDVHRSKKIINSIINTLADFNIIKRNQYFTGGTVFSIVKNESNDIYSIVSSVDPFIYISHLSAMNLYGLSDKITKIIYITEPSNDIWDELAKAKMKNDNIIFENTTKLRKTNFSKINNYNIVKYVDKIYGDYKILKNENVRISSLSRTFFDMIRKPDFCGGIQHVLSVYKEFGAQNSDAIIDQINNFGSAVEKVRAGYILEEFCGVRNSIVDSWTKFCQRGGSRKLDSSKEYKSNYSERWCLSINL